MVLERSGKHDLSKLRGARLVLTDPVSTSGSLLPRRQFEASLGQTLERYFGSVSFSGSHGRSIQSVLKGDADAGFISSIQLEEALLTGRLDKGQVRVLWSSEPIPNDPFVYRGALCEGLRKQIRSAFLGEEADQELGEMLRRLKSVRFVPVDDRLYQPIRDLLAR